MICRVVVAASFHFCIPLGICWWKHRIRKNFVKVEVKIISLFNEIALQREYYEKAKAEAQTRLLIFRCALETASPHLTIC